MKIKLPKNPIKKEEIMQINRKLLSDDFERGGMLAKVLVFTKMNEPVSNENLKDIMQNYYKIEIDISRIKIATKRLNDLGMLNVITSGEIMTMPPNEHTDLHKDAYKKFFLYLEHIPKQFRRSYDKLKFFWVSNGDGVNYIEWACRLLGFDLEK